MTNTAPKIVLGLIVLLALVGIVAGVVDNSGNLEVIAQNNLLRITNVGNQDVQLVSVTINDRKDCSGYDLTVGGRLLKVGDQRLIMSPCNVVRATVATDNGSNTYTFAR